MDQFEQTEFYRGHNPAFVHRVWEKRRKEAGQLPLNVNHTGRKRELRHIWTCAEKSIVAGMLRRGLTAGQIGQRFGKSKCSVFSLVRTDPKLRAIGFANSRPRLPGRSLDRRNGQ